jgi:hypothetical protein
MMRNLVNISSKFNVGQIIKFHKIIMFNVHKNVSNMST